MSTQRLICRSTNIFKNIFDPQTKFQALSIPLSSIQTRTKYSKVVRKPLKKFIPSSRNEIIEQNETDFGIIEDTEIVPIVDENLKHDRLPDGLTLDKLPKFERILGWDKSNPIIK